ncbi:MAG: prepilin-type N-terminal cleavage/methylation domain-containing protein [Elusimicrobiaceae bacterium]|nr:prepilin-type N-terminal cleavage/methylation domain-containing protein [Elusimicrobiaceae bacterium]
MNKKGFTLIELLAVLLIVAILTAVGVPQYRRSMDRAHVAEAQTLLRTIYDSSERLAGEFGYRSYDRLLQVKGAVNEPNFSFGRLDMFDATNLPSQCSLEDNGTTLVCSRFRYKISVNGYVAAKKRTNPYQNTYILLDRNTLELYCQPAANAGSVACDIYALDVRNANVSF